MTFYFDGMCDIMHIYTVGARTVTAIEQTGLTSVRVSWTPIPDPSVTGYTVHYLLAGGHGGNGTQTVTADTTNTEITGLINGGTYIFSVATVVNSPNILPGIAENIFTLGMTVMIVDEVHTHSLKFLIHSSTCSQLQILLMVWQLLQSQPQSECPGRQ